MDRSKLPVYIVTGFLGSGKTTLLRNALANPSAKNTALIVNEFGEVALDHHLLRTASEQISLLGGGCVCCQVRDDLVQEMKLLLSAHESGEIILSSVVIETTGLADPAPIIFTILTDPMLQHHFEIAGTIATVDAVNGLEQLERNPESIKQVITSDKLILTKTDIASSKDIDYLIRKLKGINPVAEIVTAINGLLINDDLFQISRSSITLATPNLESLQNHTGETSSFNIRFQGAIDWAPFVVWLSLLLHAHGEEVLRVKGMLDVGEGGPIVLQGVQHVIHPPEHLSEWQYEKNDSTLTFILRRISSDEVISSLRAFSGFFGGEVLVK
ncbi:GTP-binding protein [Thermoactinomyces sp. CICC 10522]|uniref:CobW family GTP-binding protein n=1 Tax=Thermoactinomyces sp. CICC 10522 TaxID=2767427 RepID=UPI0018DCF7E9|nr:GTP-binding protein [Thermoactinomyces sp. CICC 10522]MBH8605883.1 GTP-binding protein [Thermoactinomyces sp. CICC 10522]